MGTSGVTPPDELEFYTRRSQRATADLHAHVREADIGRLVRASASGDWPTFQASFPAPILLWLDALHDMRAQWEAYVHLAPVRDRRLLQLGGHGSHAVKFLLAGAAEAFLLSPVLAEVEHGRALARYAGVGERFRAIQGVAEALPFSDGSFDGIYSGGSVHHMATEVALPECARVLSEGGRFAAVEPWRAPLYGIGTRLFGKREAVNCRPLTSRSLEPFPESFPDGRISRHGPVFRYPLIALAKAGVRPRPAAMWRMGKLDDALLGAIPILERMASSVALLGIRGPAARR